MYVRSYTRSVGLLVAAAPPSTSVLHRARVENRHTMPWSTSDGYRRTMMRSVYPASACLWKARAWGTNVHRRDLFIPRSCVCVCVCLNEEYAVEYAAVCIRVRESVEPGG